MKNIPLKITLMLFLIVNVAFSQVGIGTTTPNAALDIDSALPSPSTHKAGLLPPIVALSATNSIATTTAGVNVINPNGGGNPVTGTIVYNTNTSAAGATQVTPGYYFFNGTAWEKITSGTSTNWGLTGNSGTSAGTNYIGTNDVQDFVIKTSEVVNTPVERMKITSTGNVGINATTPTATALLTINPNGTIQNGIDMTMTGATGTATGLNIATANSNVNGITVTQTSGTSASLYGIGGVLSSTNIVSGYNGYRNGSGLSYGLFGINGTTSTYATNASTWAAFLKGRTVISSETSPSSALGTDLEVRNTTTGAAAPATVSLRQTNALTTNGTVMTNLNFGDNHVTTPQAQIQVLRDAAAGSGDMPTAMTFSTTPDASATLNERMRITNAGQLGIGTTTPQGVVDITSATNGVLIPRVSLTATNVAAPVVNPQGGALVEGTLVWNTATLGTFPNNVIPGFYYWKGSWISVTGAAANSWSLAGNGGINGGNTTTAGTNFIGTTDAQNIDFRTNNAFVGRFSSLGEFFVGTLSTTLPGDLCNSVGNTTFPWAVNGYTAFTGGGVYGGITSGSSPFGAVQGEYDGTNSFGGGVVGLTRNTAAGTDFVGSAVSAVYGGLENTSTRSFGVFGDVLDNVTIRTGGVLGTDGVRSGALGYFNSGSNSFSVYGFNQAYTTGAAGGRMANPNYINTSIGLGIYGGVIGGWIKGDEYGTVFSGKQFSSYNLGKVISNEDYVVISGKDNKVVSYATTALQPEINSKGIAKLVNGRANVLFDKTFSQLVDKSKPIIVTCTPMGETKGVFLAEVTSEGFKIKENQNGSSTVSFSWMAIGEKDVSDKQELSDAILDKDFEANLNGVMHDENLEGGKAIWSQNGKVQFGDKAPENSFKKRDKQQRGRNKTTVKKN